MLFEMILESLRDSIFEIGVDAIFEISGIIFEIIFEKFLGASLYDKAVYGASLEGGSSYEPQVFHE